MARQMEKPRRQLEGLETERLKTEMLTARTRKRGARARPLSGGSNRRGYFFFAVFFLPALAVFFAIVLIPPFVWVSVTGGLAAPSPRRCRLARLASMTAPPISMRTTRARCTGFREQKTGGVATALTPGPVTGLPLLCGLLLRAGLGSLLRHSSSLGSVAAQLVPVPRGHKRWAERSTYIQDVDYG
jgi:hypothetical protein